MYEDYLVDHKSAMAGTEEIGTTIQLGVRWWKQPPTDGGRERKPPVIMVHGRSIPGLVSFDLDAENRGYSWARELWDGEDGRDVFIMDLQGTPFTASQGQTSRARPPPCFAVLDVAAAVVVRLP